MITPCYSEVDNTFRSPGKGGGMGDKGKVKDEGCRKEIGDQKSEKNPNLDNKGVIPKKGTKVITEKIDVKKVRLINLQLKVN